MHGRAAGPQPDHHAGADGFNSFFSRLALERFYVCCHLIACVTVKPLAAAGAVGACTAPVEVRPPER
ncbi:hypothetical protein RZS08_05570 [Arthrospira platensis SPKY1]|nr:hypothetical protein [Arthrospira platensis SPKY1]